MNKKYIAPLVVGLLIVGAGVYYFTNRDSSSTTSTGTTPKSSSTSTPINELLPSPVIHNVSIVSSKFSPASITVRKGETIVWTNEDSIPHTVTGGTNGDINSPSLAQNQTYSFVFDKTGVFSYYCKLHPSMKGTITVVN